MCNTCGSFFKGPINFMEESADYDSIETDMMLSYCSSQKDTDCKETVDITWAEALPFVPGQAYHSGGKFL